MLNTSILQANIGRCRALLVMASQSFLLSATVPTGSRSNDEADILVMLFCRNGQRALYHANFFLINYDKITAPSESTLAEGQEVGIAISDDLFFDFDAFVIACKSVMEGKVVDRAKALHPSVKGVFDQIAKDAKANLIDRHILPIRNEVTHLNLLGTSIGSMAFLKRESNVIKIRLRTNFVTSLGREPIELSELFDFILSGFMSICWRIAGVFIAHYFLKYGAPSTNKHFNYDGSTISLSEIEIPGFTF